MSIEIHIAWSIEILIAWSIEFHIAWKGNCRSGGQVVGDLVYGLLGVVVLVGVLYREVLGYVRRFALVVLGI